MLFTALSHSFHQRTHLLGYLLLHSPMHPLFQLVKEVHHRSICAHGGSHRSSKSFVAHRKHNSVYVDSTV